MGVSAPHGLKTKVVELVDFALVAGIGSCFDPQNLLRSGQMPWSHDQNSPYSLTTIVAASFWTSHTADSSLAGLIASAVASIRLLVNTLAELAGDHLRLIIHLAP